MILIALGSNLSSHAGTPEETLRAALEVNARFRRTLAGAMVTLAADRITVERAPARRIFSKKQAKMPRKTRHRG